MQENSLRFKDLIEIIGSKSKVSEVLNKKRRLTLEMNPNRPKWQLWTEKKINDLEELKKSVLQKAFSGELKTNTSSRMKHEIESINQEEYGSLLQQAVEQIRTARIVVAKYINNATQSVYWNLGKLLFEKQLADGYGSGVVNQLSVDLKTEFPDMGLSPRNLWDMKRFYERYYSADTKLLQAVAVLPWGHNLLLINKVQSLEAAAFYTNQTIEKAGAEICYSTP